jgi:hypothetical protein
MRGWIRLMSPWDWTAVTAITIGLLALATAVLAFWAWMEIVENAFPFRSINTQAAATYTAKPSPLSFASRRVGRSAVVSAFTYCVIFSCCDGSKRSSMASPYRHR